MNNIIEVNNDTIDDILSFNKSDENTRYNNFTIINNSALFKEKLVDNYYRNINYQIELVISGTVEYSTFDNTYCLTKGSLLLLPSYCICKMTYVSKDFNSIGLDFSPEYTNSILTPNDIVYIKNIGNDNYNTFINFKEIFAHFSKLRSKNDVLFSHLISTLLLFIKQIYISSKGDNKYLKREREIYTKFMYLLRNNPQSYDIGFFTDKLLISKSYLQNTIHKISGLSATKVINKERMNIPM